MAQPALLELFARAFSSCAFTKLRVVDSSSKRNIPEVADKYPEGRMMGRLPSYRFFVCHPDRVRLRFIQSVTDQPDARPAFVIDDVDDVILGGLDLSAPVGGAPLIDLRNTRRAFLTGMRSPPGMRNFAEIGAQANPAFRSRGTHWIQAKRLRHSPMAPQGTRQGSF